VTSIEVVVASYARPEPLKRTLAALTTQTEADFSVAVVDDCSPQPIADWLKAEQYPFPLRLLKTDRNSGPAAARNQAVNTSEATFIAFVDDDVAAHAGLLAAHRAVLCRLGENGVSIGPLAAPQDWRPTPWNRWEADSLEIEYRRMQDGEYRPTWRQFFTGNAMLSRRAFLDAGGFDPEFTRAEDIEFAYRMALRGAIFEFEPKAIGWHYAQRSLESWRRIPGQYARFDSEIAALHPELRWDEQRERERKGLHPLTRFVERAAATVHGEHAVGTAAIALAVGAHRVGARVVSNSLLSLTFELEYGRASRHLIRKQHFNPPSTALS
jgi:GT2 family glycosyltransferase